MAHQWYGDEVTPDDWSDLWMSEGMATYLAEANWTADHGPATRAPHPDRLGDASSAQMRARVRRRRPTTGPAPSARATPTTSRP